MAERKVVNSHDFMCEGYDSNGNKVVPRGESSYLMARTIVLVYENGTTQPVCPKYDPDWDNTMCQIHSDNDSRGKCPYRRK